MKKMRDKRIKKILCIVIRLENCLKMSTAHNIT